MSNTSNAEKSSQNLPFYLNDFEEKTQTLLCLRLRGILNYKNVISADFSHTEQQLSDQFDDISNDLQNLNFFIKSLNLILSNNEKIKSQNIINCADLYQKYFQKPIESKDTSIERTLSNFIPIDLLKTVSIPKKEEQNYSPLFTNHKGICRLQLFKIPIDCLVLVHPDTSISSLHEIIIEKLNLHLHAIKNCYRDYYQNENTFEAETFNFVINNQNSSSLIITCVYPNKQTDDILTPLRKEIHNILELPTDRPLLRRVDAFQFIDKSNQLDKNQYSKYLTNPHLNAKPSTIKNGKQSLVQGDYLYFHYMQENFNDNGWGCAYRSFQTIFSWFRLQSYTQKPVPTHVDIQKALVAMGDKQPNFIGSSKWIGSMEISFCLNQMLNIDCKILSVSKGSELADKARELQYHFDTEGTPVMIGGGVLAHTIVGVDFNEMTGDVQFLILDPHYTGGEDVKTITTKGWVGWKDTKFWNENSYYNMCCPIRPKGV